MPRLYDLLSDKDKSKVDSWEVDRMNPKHEPDIPPELYTIAEAGYYWGWSAIEAIMRGYVEKKVKKKVDGKVTEVTEYIPITMTDIVALCKAANKVKYRDMLDRGRITTAANIAGNSKNPEKTWNDNTKGYQREAKI